jgi:hypothetical protein
MKTILAAAALLLVTALTSLAQQHYDVTVRDENRLRPGATQAEIEQWMKSQAIESAFAAAIRPQPSQNAPPLSAEQIHLIKVLAIRATILDQILKDHPELKSQADALYVQYDSQFSEALLKAQRGGR